MTCLSVELNIYRLVSIFIMNLLGIIWHQLEADDTNITTCPYYRVQYVPYYLLKNYKGPSMYIRVTCYKSANYSEMTYRMFPI